jgi:hypothetical protein
LWKRLEKEERLIEQKGDINQTTLMNFVPTRPLEEIAHEYVDAFWQLYDPEKYLERNFRYYMKLGTRKHSGKGSFRLNRQELRGLLTLMWRQGVVRKTRWKFWLNLLTIIRHKPNLANDYLTRCSFLEHFFEYRLIIRDKINAQLATYLANNPACVSLVESTS